MSEENIQHAVTHKLYLELSGSYFNAVITDKNNHVLDSSSFFFTAADDLDRLISTENKLQSIYSNILLVNSGCRFVAMPQSISETQDKREIYGVSYSIQKGYELLEDHIGIQLQVNYEQDGKLMGVLRKYFPKMKIYHELSLLHDTILHKLSDEVNNIVAHITRDSLVILAFNQGKMIFCNHFLLSGNDDLFYFVMLTVEQLEFDPEYTGVMVLNDQNHGKNFKEMFNRFVKTVDTPERLLEYQVENIDQPASISFAIQAAIQCA